MDAYTSGDSDITKATLYFLITFFVNITEQEKQKPLQKSHGK